MVRSDGFVVIDGSLPIEEQQQSVRNTVSELMPKAMASKLKVGAEMESHGRR